MSGVTKEIQDNVSQLYIAFFGRAPEAQGFGFWANALASGSVTVNQIAASFAKTPEFNTVYAGLTPEQQVNRLYQNVLNRNADPAGEKFWSDAIKGGLPFSDIAYSIVNTAFKGGSGVNPDDNALVKNKVTVSEYFAITLSSNDGALAKTAFQGVDTTPESVTQAEARLSAGSGETFALTTGADNFAPSGSNNTFAGQVTPQGQLTWQSWDTITGGPGVDTLNADLNGNLVTMTNVSGVENFNLNVSTAAATMDVAGGSYIQKITANQSAGLTINSLGSLPAINLSGVPGAANTFNFTAAALTPAAQTLNVSLAGFTGTGLTLTDVGANALESIAIASTGAANSIGGLTTSGMGTTSLVLSGTQNLAVGAITDTNATLRTVDASAATGNVSVTVLASSTVTGGAGNDTVTSSGGVDNFNGGAGNDTFVMGATVTSADTINGGEGTDVLSASAATLAAFTTAAPTTNISNIETLTLSTAMAADTLTLSAIQAGIANVNVATAGAAQTGTVIFDSGVAGTIAVGSATVAADLGAFAVQSAGTGTADSVTIANRTAASSAFSGAITATGVETLTLNGSTSTTAITQAPTTITATASTGGTSTVVFTGNNTFAPTGIITANAIDASGLGINLAGAQSILTMSAGANTARTITGSAGADTLLGNLTLASSIDGGVGNDTITGGTGNDTLRGGDGNDVITASTGSDSVDGGAGNDRVVFASGQLTSGDTVDGGEGTDVLHYTTYVAAADNLTANQSRVSNFETIRIEGVAAAAQGLTMTQYINNAGFTSLQLAAQATNADGVAVTNASAQLNAINVVAASATIGSHSFARLVDTSTDSLTISNSVAAAGGAAVITALTALDEETITITATVPTTAGNNDLTITTLTVADLTTLNINSASDVIITNAIAGTFSLATVNATAATGAVTVNATGTGVAVTMTGNTASTASAIFTGGAFADSITGGGGADTLIGGGGRDTISGGGGNDVIEGGAGADVMTGGAGNVHFRDRCCY